MATPGKAFPAKIKDAIVEAIFEVRFETTTVQEILIGRLADYEPWRSFQQRKLPAYEIPAAFRQVDQNLRYTTIFELREVSCGVCVLGRKLCPTTNLHHMSDGQPYAPN